jgi:hypothetical protein
VALAVALFAAAWATVFAQMVSGHDPVLGTGTASRSASSHGSQHASSNRTPPSTGTQLVPVQTPQGVVFVRVPSGGSTEQTAPAQQPAPAPSPPPVTTRTS